MKIPITPKVVAVSEFSERSRMISNFPLPVRRRAGAR